MTVSRAETGAERAAREARLPNEIAPVRTLTAEERAAFIASRPELLEPLKAGEGRGRR